MVYVLSLTVAFTNALTSVLQRMGVEDAPDEATLRLSLLRHAIRRGVWLLGFVLLIGAFLLQAVALHLGDLSQVQPILTLELLFLVLMLATWFGFHIGLREWIGALAAGGGLAGFLWCAQPGRGTAVPDDRQWIVVGVICAAIALAAVLAARRGPRWWRAAMFGVAGAIGFAFSASLMKSVGNVVATHWTHIFGDWQTYALAVVGLAALFLTQNAYHAGPIAASQTSLVLVDPLASICMGLALFNDNLRTAGAYGPLEALSLLVMFVGAASLAHSPLIAGAKGVDDRSEEMLSTHIRSKRPPRDLPEQLPTGLTHP